MSTNLADLLNNPNVKNYLSMIAQTEGTAQFADPYRVAFGGKVIDSLDDHPNLRSSFRQTDGKVNTTTAAGKYQFQKRTWDELKDKLGLPDFGPKSQDMAALALLERNGSLPHVLSGDYDRAVAIDGKTWASLPSSPYAQPKKEAEFVKTALGQGQRAPSPNTATLAASDEVGLDTPASVPRAAAPAAGRVAAAVDKPVASGTPSVDKILAAINKAKAAGDAEAVNELGGLLRSKVEPAIAKARDAGDDAAVQELSSLISDTGLGSTAMPAKETPFDWAGTGRRLFKKFNGKEFAGDDVQATKWLKQEMSDFNNNFVAGGLGVARAKLLDAEGKKDLIGAMDAYDKLSTFEVLPEIGQSLITDPLNVLTLGVGKLATKVGQTATKEAVKRGLRESLGKTFLERAEGKAINAVTGNAAKLGAEGAAYSAASDAVNQNIRINADGQDGYDIGQGAKAASLGLLLGGGLGKVIDHLGGTSAIEKFAKRAGSEEGTRIDAEIVKQLNDINENPNFRDLGLRAEQFNQVAQTPINDIKKLISVIGDKELAANGFNRMELDKALNNWKSLSSSEIDAMRGTNLGDSAAAAIERAQRVRSLTSETTASGGVLKAARALTDVAPIPGPLSRGLKAVLGSGKSRKEVGREVVGQVKTAERILDDMGASNTAEKLGRINPMMEQALQDKAQKAADAQFFKEMVKRQAEAQKRADNFEKTDLFKTVSKMQDDFDKQAMDAQAMQMGTPDIDAMRAQMPRSVDPSKVEQTDLFKLIQQANRQGDKEAADALATQVGTFDAKAPNVVNQARPSNSLDSLISQAQANAAGILDPKMDGGQVVRTEIANILSEGKQSTREKVQAKREARLAAKQAARAEADAQTAAILRNGTADLNNLGGGSLKATIDRMAALGIDAQQTHALIDNLRTTTDDPELAKVLGKLLNNEAVGSKRDKLLYKIQDNILIPHAQKMFPEATPPMRQAFEQAAREVDAKGNPILSRPAYEQGAKANQKVYTDARAAIDTMELSAKEKSVAKDIIDDLRTGSPSKAIEVLTKVQTKLDSLGADAAKVEPIIASLIAKFYQS